MVMEKMFYWISSFLSSPKSTQVSSVELPRPLSLTSSVALLVLDSVVLSHAPS